MFKDKEIINLLESIQKELKSINVTLKSRIVKGIATKTNKGGKENNG